MDMDSAGGFKGKVGQARCADIGYVPGVHKHAPANNYASLSSWSLAHSLVAHGQDCTFDALAPTLASYASLLLLAD